MRWGTAREREPGKGKELQGKRGRAGRLRAAAWRLQRSRGTGRQPGGGAASVRHAAASVRGEEDDRGGSGGGLGRAAGPGGLPGERQVRFLSLSLFFLFLFCFIYLILLPLFLNKTNSRQ